MSFPNSFDDDTTLPFVNDNITEIGGEAINAVREATIAIEQNIGLNAQGSMPTIAARLDVSLLPDGNIKPSAIASMGLVTLPIVDSQIADWAAIPERKLQLDHRTQDLFNYIRDLSGDVNLAIGWINSTGIKLEPHLVGQIYRHELNHINVNSSPSNYLLNNLRLLRDNSDSYQLIKDMNDELLAHQWADGSPINPTNTIITNDGSTFPSNFAHTAGGIFINTSRFATIPQTADDLQAFAEFIDGTSIFLLGTRLQNLYSNGISRESRSSSLVNDGYGAPIIPSTPAIAYFKNLGNSSSPVDDINYGDDIVELRPPSSVLSNNSFDEKFALVKVGDIIRVNYGTIEIPFVIKEKKYIQNGGNKKFIIRIAGKNIQYAPNASARIDKPLVNINKYSVLAVAAANSGFPTIQPSLITVNPRGAQALGLGFNADQFDASHYALYLALFPTGKPEDGYVILPPIDVTGNGGITPGAYTLDSIVSATNEAFRKPGYNYRFVAFQYQGEFGIALADSYNNAGFSILSAVVTSSGTLDPVGSAIAFPSNVVGMFAADGYVAPDPLGFGPTGSAIASPPYQSSYASPEAAVLPTKLFLPLKRNNYYVNGTEREKLNLDIDQVLDDYGDGYWFGNIVAQTIIPGSPGQVQTTYRIPLDLSASQLKKGKTIVVQGLDGYGTFPNDFGRFIIENVALGCCSPSDYTDITVLDSVHGLGTTGSSGLVLGIGGKVAIYFTSDSISLNLESATDYASVSPFKRHLEIYIDENGNTFTHERARFNAGPTSPLLVNDNIPLVNYSELVKINFVKVSPKLKGYQYGDINKITLFLNTYDSVTGNFDGYLAAWNGNLATPADHKGPITSGKRGLVSRFYDETYVDYIDLIFDFNTAVSSFSNQKLDFQLFPTLSLDNQIMMIGTFQFDDVAYAINYLKDERQFGNISEKDLTTSALNYIAGPERLLHGNGVIRGFELQSKPTTTNPNMGHIFLSGGEVLVNGKFIQKNSDAVIIYPMKEVTSGISPTLKINWLICINSLGEYEILPLLDPDPILNTSSNTTRAFIGQNLVTGGNYNLNGSTFANVINNRKDLTLLYIAAATSVATNPPTVTLVMHDVRKFVNDGDTILPLKLTSSNAQGNFKNIVPIFNWVKYNNTFNGTVIVKGANSSNATINSAVELHFDNGNVTIDGQNNSNITFNAALTVGSNLTFKNTVLNLPAGMFIKSNTNISNLVFEGCTLNITLPTTAVNTTALLDITNGNNIKFKDCSIVVIWNKTLPVQSYEIQTTFPTVLRLNNTTNFVFENSSMSVNYTSANPGVTAPGGHIVLINTDGAIITESEFSGNVNRSILLSNSDNVRFTNSVITSTYNPMADGFDDANMVNSGNGFVYCYMTNPVDDILINNVSFNYSPTGDPSVNTDLNARHPFISFELTTLNSILSNLKVTNCRFNHLNTGAVVTDNRPAIAIINTYALTGSPTIANSQQLRLVGAVISGNICSHNQSVIITSRRDGNGIMNYPGLAAQGCVIRDNVCGNIGYFVTNAVKTVNLSPNFTSLSDKATNLTIDNNLCHYIYNCDEEGIYFPISKLVDGYSANMSNYATGYVNIDKNKANWIHVGIAYEENSSINISNNVLHANAESYLTIFGENDANSYGSGSIRSYKYAIFVGTNKYTQAPAQTPSEGNDVSIRISGNTTNQGYWYQTIGTTTNYMYSGGYIFCQGSGIITQNNLRGAGGGNLILVGGTKNLIKDNFIYRENIDVSSYVRFDNFENPIWGGHVDGNGAGSQGIVVDNFFDKPTINAIGQFGLFNGISFSAGPINISSTAAPGWIVERNKNQTAVAIVPWTNGHILYHMVGGSAYGPDGYDDLYMRPSGDSPVGPFTGTYRSRVLRFRDNESIDLRKWGTQVNVEAFVPNSVRIIKIDAAIRSFGTVVAYDGLADASDTSNFWINLSSHDLQNIGVGVAELDFFTSVADNDDGIYEYSNAPVFDNVTGADFNATSFGIPFSIDLTNYNGDDISNRYITGRGIGITLALDTRWSRNVASVNFLISPVLVTYRW